MYPLPRPRSDSGPARMESDTSPRQKAPHSAAVQRSSEAASVARANSRAADVHDATHATQVALVESIGLAEPGALVTRCGLHADEPGRTRRSVGAWRSLDTAA